MNINLFSYAKAHTHLLIRDLQQFQDHTVSSHVPEEPLLLFLILLARDALQNTQFAQPQKDLHPQKITKNIRYTSQNILLACQNLQTP